MRLTDVIHLVASLATVIVFMTGSSSLPILLDQQSLGTAPDGLSTGIIEFFTRELQVAIVLITTPLFNFFDTWFAISLARTFFALLSSIGISIEQGVARSTSGPVNSRLQKWIRELRSATSGIPGSAILVSVVMILPAVIGVNLAFQVILFGEIAQPFPILLVIASTLVTAVLYRIWIQKLLAPAVATTTAPEPLQNPFSVTGLNPTSGRLLGTTSLQVFGTGLVVPIQVFLEHGFNTLLGTRVSAGDSQLHVEFYLPDTASTGAWDVVVKKPGHTDSRLEGAFFIQEPHPEIAVE